MRIFRNLNHATKLLDEINLIKEYYIIIMNKIRYYLY